MSNNNPHGHINQPAQNPSWNPLQIPSYIPRQPQLAHMSNERPMVRSPLAWHAPAPPPDSIYNFMSANHKNLEHQMNPLLPPYVRGPSPFDSMDLSVQSSRSSNSPLNKSGQPHSVLPPHDYGHKQHPHQQQQQQQHHQQQQQQQQSQMHAPNTYPIHLPTSSPSTITHSHAVTHTHSHQQQQQRQQSQHQHSGGVLNPHGMPQSSATGGGSGSGTPANTKYLSSNGNDCEMLPPPLGISSGNTATSSNVTGSGNNAPTSSVAPTDPNVSYMRDSEQRINESYSKMTNMNRNYENELQSKPLPKPVELVSKDCNYTMLSNKMSHQVSPKKHSPIRNYHPHPQQQQQQHQQQQQQQQHYNSTHTISHNGPHTPPTPQSPVGQLQSSATASSASTSTTTMQQLQTESRIMQNSNVMDYNQLHLQHNNNYAQQPHHPHQQQQISAHQQQQQQQHQQPSPSSHHHHPQQQQHQQHQTHHLHFGSLIHQQLQPPPQPTAPLQQIQQHQPHHRTSPAANTGHQHITNLDTFAAQSNLKLKELDMPKSILHELSPAATPTIAHMRKQQNVGSLLTIRNESPDNATSNEDSVDSNSNSSRARRKRKPNKIGRTLSNESEIDEVIATPLMPKNEQVKQQPKYEETIPLNPDEQQIHNINNSPSERSPNQQQKSPRKIETHSHRTEESRRLVHTQLVEHKPSSDSATIAASVQHLHHQSPTLDEKDYEKHQTIENGRSAVVSSTASTNKCDNDNDVETIDKIAEMIAQSGSGSGNGGGSGSNELNSNSNSSSKSNISSPKTKKQRQALKLRSAEQNSNSNCSTNSYSGSLPDGGGAANDNAVLAEELRKDPTASLADASKINTTFEQATTKAPLSIASTAASSAASCPLSPQSNSRSCSSSSSSSSSCSNSSRSSCGSKENNKLRSVLELSSKVTKEPQQQCSSANTTNVRDITSANSNGKSEVLKYADRNDSKNSLDSSHMERKKDRSESPAKSCFEEVENKLEEMFAGIEDELPASAEDNLLPTPVNEAEVAHDLSLALELSAATSSTLVNQPPPSIKNNDVEEHLPAAAIELPLPAVQAPLVKSDKPPPTKAAKKSTLPSPEQIRTPTPTPPMPTKVTPSRPRRLSVLIEPTNLRIHLEKGKSLTPQQDNSAVIQISDDEKPSTSAAAAAAAAAVSQCHNTVTAATNKSKPAKESSSNETRKDLSTSSSKKNRGKTNANRGKIKGKGIGGGGSGGGKTVKGKANANSSSSKKQQQHQKQKRKQQDSDDDNTPARENCSSQLVADSKYKSPYILVKRDGTITVINAPTAEDVSEKQTKVKKSHQSYAHDRKNIRGMHSSTLSNKYDADTADKTWICVFCKRGPHRMGLGDLFGPYIITIDCEEYRTAVKAPGVLDIDAVFANKRRRLDMVQRHPRNLPVVPATLGAAQLAATSNRAGGSNKKKKKSTDEPPQSITDPLDISINTANVTESFLGMSKVSEKTYEVWLHEDCAVWAPDVFLVGARVMGLDAAVWNSTRYNCVICAKTGAIVCCLQRGCNEAAHVPCARESQWSLNENDFKIYCQKHVAATSSLGKVTPPPTTTAITNSSATLYS